MKVRVKAGVRLVVVMAKIRFRECIMSTRVLTCVKLQMCVCMCNVISAPAHYDITGLLSCQIQGPSHT